ncbi:MAG TPA: hypothetical protein VGO61_04255 [Steroidobacteraceae bacterium]|jgi:hypothetical protein|nr:hypothetical protein [Steroidobacteraceae bacterium]
MAQTFDIRFARSAGLAGFFEAPANEFRWKGAGRLSIDASGISIALRRGLMTVFARAQFRRIAANRLIEVYREGNALRLEFSTRESARAVLPFWASDRIAAAEIVTLLPTHRSVELEDTGSARRYRFDRRLGASLLVGVVMLGAGAVALQRYLADEPIAASVMAVAQPPVQVPAREALTTPPASKPDANSQLAVGTSTAAAAPAPAASGRPIPLYMNPPELPASSLDSSVVVAEPVLVQAEAAAPGADANSRTWVVVPSTDGVYPIVAGDPRYEIARREFDRFQAERAQLRANYLYERDFPNAERLEAIEAGWMVVTARIYDSRELAAIEFIALREMELAVSRGWRVYLSVHAAGLRADNKALVRLSSTYLASAEALESMLPRFVH